jgi:class 3 adenylate cyclase
VTSTIPAIRYARSGDVSIAYQVIGDGPLDLVFVHGAIGNLEVSWEQPDVVKFYERLASFARLITFDRRGTGLSDRVAHVPPLETRMDDLRAVMDAAGSHRAALLATFETAAMACLFSATYPERVGALAVYNPTVRGSWAPDFPWASTEEETRREVEEIRARWGTDEYVQEFAQTVAPSRAADPEFRQWVARLWRLGASPGAAASVQRMFADIDIRDVLPAMRVPTLVLSIGRFRESARYAAERIPEARLVELPGDDIMITLKPTLPDEVERFVKEAWGEREPETVLSTVLFTDIVGSTERAAELGDARWRELVSCHHALVRTQLDRHGGKEMDTAGDGFFATFDGPIRAIRCATTVRDAVRDLGLEVRAGLHTGECQVSGEKVSGMAVNIGARISAQAVPGEVLVSSTVKDLVVGSGIAFAERGVAQLKGVPGEWSLYAVADS